MAHRLKTALATAVLVTAHLAVSPASAGELTVKIDGLPSDAGRARIVLLDSKAGYEGRSEPMRIVSVAIENGAAAWQAGEVPAGRYAIIVHHDANADNELDRPLFWLPVEPYGFTRNAWVSFGVPSWESTSIDIGAAPLTEAVSVRLNPIAAILLAVKSGAPALGLIALGLAGLAIARRRNRRTRTSLNA